MCGEHAARAALRDLADAGLRAGGVGEGTRAG